MKFKIQDRGMYGTITEQSDGLNPVWTIKWENGDITKTQFIFRHWVCKNKKQLSCEHTAKIHKVYRRARSFASCAKCGARLKKSTSCSELPSQKE